MMHGLAPRRIYSDDGDALLLAATKEDALRQAQADAPLDHIADVTAEGWMLDVGWDRENYERKRDFVAESGYTSWWESCRPPCDGQATAKCMPAWSVVYCDGCDQCAGARVTGSAGGDPEP